MLVCETVSGASTAELRSARDAVRGVDLVELRLDGVGDPDVRAALADRRLPVIVTCRPTWEGGRFDGSEEERRRLLEQALEAGAEFVDLEWRAGWAGLVERRRGRGIVLSVHDFNGVPADLGHIYQQMKATGAEIVKIAVTARRLCDVFALEKTGKVPMSEQGLVFIAMGASGLATRILPSRFGSRWTYVGAAAPGQVSAERLLGEFRVRDLTPATAVYGVVGTCVSRSLSPSIHNAAFRAAGVDAVYLPLPTEDFDDFLAFADCLPLAGASVTMPFKEAAMRPAVACDEIARSVGAVNTLRRDAAGWQATNTDVDGFLAPIRHFPLCGQRVSIVGAGGAARAVAVGVARAGGRVNVFSRRVDRAREVAELIGGDAFEGVPAKGTWDVLVNATPVGSAADPERTPVPADRLDGRLVYDLVYDPAETRLLREARAAGCRAIGGLEMLHAQAAGQRRFWGQV